LGRLPLWATAILLPAALVLDAGWAFSQREPPVVEWRVWPMARCPREGGQYRLAEHVPHQPHLLGDERVAIVGGGHAGRLLAAVGERVEPVVHEVGDRFPGAQTPHASRGWPTPKQILPKRGVWERHADANRFCAADTNFGSLLR
jgi:hypothetical protein